ncbi:MAG: PD40 domain-containing protein, partial [Bacteroidales bacterium]|nr:PD40 domain-containing protein [Bacteroidales bacterium]
GLYHQAQDHLNKYSRINNIPDQNRTAMLDLLERCDFALFSINNPVSFNPVNLGDSINSVYDEYINALTLDDQQLYLTVKKAKHPDNDELYPDEDFYLSQAAGTAWGRVSEVGYPVNTPGNEGALNISPDGRYLFFVACHREDGYGSCDIYISRRINDKWTMPKNLGPIINSSSWESQPGLSSDGRTLYFSSTREGGKGKSDIWESTFLQSGKWSPPENLGDTINTPGEEMSPFIHPDDNTLYFSSNGHIGMGGLDLFISRKDSSGHWAEPLNLGYPINTFADEINIIVASGAEKAYFSSDKLGGKGKNDIYSFLLDPKIKPSKVTYLKGIVYDQRSEKRLEAAFELINLENGHVVVESFSDPFTGEFLVCLPTKNDYALNVSCDNYLFYSENFTMTGENPVTDPYLINIPLNRIKEGEIVILKNIFFETDSYLLKEQSFVEIRKIESFLIDNPGIVIEIRGHTDNVGAEDHNAVLSLNRAKAVYDFLIERGISPDRLSYNGYGFSVPSDTNDTEEGRSINRRTEFRVLRIDPKQK